MTRHPPQRVADWFTQSLNFPPIRNLLTRQISTNQRSIWRASIRDDGAGSGGAEDDDDDVDDDDDDDDDEYSDDTKAREASK